MFAIAAVLALVLVGLAVSLYRIGSESIWFDEAVSIHYARIDLATAVDEIVGRDSNGSLYYVLLRGWVALIGSGEGQVRALSAIFAVASLPLVYRIGTALGARSVGFGGGLLLACSYTFIAYAQEARMYALVMFMATASTALLLVASGKPRRRWMVAYGGLAGLGVYAHLFMVPVIAAHGVWLLSIALRRRDRESWVRLIVGMATAGIVALPLIPFVLTSGTTAWINALTLDTVRWTFLELAGASPWLVAAAVAALVMVVPLWWVRRRLAGTRGDALMLVILWAVVPLALGLLVSLVRPALVARYFIVALPPLCLVIAYVVLSLRPRWVAVAAFAAVLAADAATGSMWHLERQKDDWRLVTQTVASVRAAGDAMTFYLLGSALPFDYYVERLGLAGRVPYHVQPGEPRARELPSGSYRRPPRIWIVLNYQWTGETPASLTALMDRFAEARYRSWGADREVGGVKLRLMIDADRPAPT
jgi:uncharacterized membrane protein